MTKSQNSDETLRYLLCQLLTFYFFNNLSNSHQGIMFFFFAKIVLNYKEHYEGTLMLLQLRAKKIVFLPQTNGHFRTLH